MKKNNKKGFAIMEILAVSVVIMVIFATVYSNFLPTTAEFEKRIKYNDVSSQYAAFYMRKLFMDVDLNIESSYYTNAYNTSSGCVLLTGNNKTRCDVIAESLGIEEIIITKYNLTSFKENASYNGNLTKYIKYLPKFNNSTTTEEQYRLIVKTNSGYATTELRVFKPADANIPTLSKNMLPVYYEGGAWKVANSNNSGKKWYNYNNAKWANAVTIKEEYRNLYFTNGEITIADGTNIDMNHINTMLVWVPRYKYTVFNYNIDGKSKSNPQIINIEFEKSANSTGTIKCYDTLTSSSTTSQLCYDSENGGDENINGSGINTNEIYSTYTHPAFTFGNIELTGIWVGKFENSIADGKINILPNQKSATNITIDNAFNNTRKMELANNIYGFNQSSQTTFLSNGTIRNDSNELDTHLIKNMEWGAITYLAYSKYGLFKNGISSIPQEVYFNNSTYIYTGRSAGNTGQYNNSTSTEGTYTYDGRLTSTNEYASDRNMGYYASCNWNITGIYDMSGGAAEFAMGNMTNYTSDFYTSMWNVNWYNKSSEELPLNRYFDAYLYELNDYTNFKRGKIGDATKETISWYNETNLMLISSKEVFKRSGSYTDNKDAGLNYYNNNEGSALNDIGYRTVLVINPTGEVIE